MATADDLIDRRRLRRKLTFWRVVALAVAAVAIVGTAVALNGTAFAAGPPITSPRYGSKARSWRTKS